MEILHCVVTNAVWCLSSHWQFWYVPSDALPLYQILKQSDTLVMDVLHFKDLRDTESVVTNSVVLVLGECQISIATYIRGWGGGVYLPSYKVVLQCIGNWQCSATLKSSRTHARTHRYRQTDRHTHTHTYRQPQYNSFATASRLN